MRLKFGTTKDTEYLLYLKLSGFAGELELGLPREVLSEIAALPAQIRSNLSGLTGRFKRWREQVTDSYFNAETPTKKKRKMVIVEKRDVA